MVRQTCETTMGAPPTDRLPKKPRPKAPQVSNCPAGGGRRDLSPLNYQRSMSAKRSRSVLFAVQGS